MQATNNFTFEAQLLREQYQKVIDQTDYYENVIKKLINQLSLQELVIVNLSNSLFTKLSDEQEEQYANETISKSQRAKLLNYDPMVLEIGIEDPFQFYGGTLKLSEIDRDRAAQNMIFRSQEIENDSLRTQVELLES